MHFAHIGKSKLKSICALILFQCLIRVIDGLSEDITCTITSYPDSVNETQCEIYHENTGCLIEQFQNQAEIGNLQILIKDCNKSSCNIDIITPVEEIGGSTFLVINGLHPQMKTCLKIIFPYLKTWEGEGQLLIKSTNIQLLQGTYWLTAYTTDIFGKQYIFVHKPLNIWNYRKKRKSSCTLVDCSFYEYEFINDTGLLRINFKFEEAFKCDKDHKNKISLLKLLHKSKTMTEDECKIYNNTDDQDVLSKAVRYRQAVEISKPPMNFHNIQTGCYVVRVRPGCFFGFFWLKSTNVVDLNKWNTSILLTPRENQGSLQVQWEWPSFPFNFTGWKLKLWKMEDYPVQCNGQNPMDKQLTTLTPSKHEILTTAEYTFTNLSAGYYCARLGGIDPRCPEDGCELRSSATILFTPRSGHVEEEPKINIIPIILLVAAGIVVGICFVIMCFRYNWTSKKTALHYELVSDKTKSMGTPSVLLIWTKYSPINCKPSPEPLIHVLKHLLKNYYFCQVFDYLDPLSLPKEQCQELMSDPTSWLNSHLRKSDVKIIIVASEGAYWRQQELNPKWDENVVSQLSNPLDKNLFPYVLHFLQESFNLAADYSRVFQVCFPDVYGNGMELKGLVASARYNMPEHISDLAYRIHGSNEYTTRLRKEPINGEFDKLHEAITLLKNS